MPPAREATFAIRRAKGVHGLRQPHPAEVAGRIAAVGVEPELRGLRVRASVQRGVALDEPARDLLARGLGWRGQYAPAARHADDFGAAGFRTGQDVQGGHRAAQFGLGLAHGRARRVARRPARSIRRATGACASSVQKAAPRSSPRRAWQNAHRLNGPGVRCGPAHNLPTSDYGRRSTVGTPSPATVSSSQPCVRQVRLTSSPA